MLCSCLSIIFNDGTFFTALYKVELTWQLPPPYPFILLPLESKISASSYPLEGVEGPTVFVKEKVSLGFTIVPFNALDVISKFFCLAGSEEYILVEKPS